MEFQLDRDLCFFDVEATGLHVIRDRIIQIAIKKFFASGQAESTYMTYINPGIPISEEAMEITGITTDVLRNKPTFNQVAKEIFEFIGSADLAGYNSNRFDVPILMEEFARAGFDFNIDRRRLIDVQRIFYRMEPRSLRAAHRFYCQSDVDNAHDAMADVDATINVLRGQLRKYKDQDLVDDEGVLEAPIQNDMQVLHDFTNDTKALDVTQRLKYNRQGKIIFNFGRYQGKVVSEVFNEDRDYYHWIMKKEFSVQVKNLAKKIMDELKQNEAKNP